jgi:hypothetical protein
MTPCVCLQVQLPVWALWVRPGINAHYHSSTFRLYASSPAHPELPLELQLPTAALEAVDDSSAASHTQGSGHQQHLRDSTAQQQHLQECQDDRQQQQQQGHKRHQQQQQQTKRTPSFQPHSCGLHSERLWATAPDGTQVPLTLLQQTGQGRSHPRPLLCEVYGAYGHVLEAEFKPHRLSLLNRGWVVALAHVRGGGELGRR